MKTLLLVSLLSTLALLSSPARAQAQTLCTLGPATAFDSMADMPAGPDAQADLKKLKALLCPKGCGKLFLYANATSPDALTATDGRGASKIVYSPPFLASVRKTYGPLGSFGVFGHELGHHLEAIGNRPAWMKEAWDAEVRADAWAGCAMAKAELKPSALQASLLVLSEFPSAHHPQWSERRAAITEGYKQCGGAVLPRLAKDGPEPASEAIAAASAGGCGSDKECRNGRSCVQSRCVAAGERRRCGKDTDCPDPQECDASGLCTLPAAQARTEEPAKEAEKTAPLLTAALQTKTPPAAPASDTTSCLKACDEGRDMCVGAATSDANRCVATIQAETGYRACSCPSYPAGNADCYSVCSSAYERGKACTSANAVKDCRADGERCRARCQ
jgi:hypothetical protein